MATCLSGFVIALRPRGWGHPRAVAGLAAGVIGLLLWPPAQDQPGERSSVESMTIMVESQDAIELSTATDGVESRNSREDSLVRAPGRDSGAAASERGWARKVKVRHYWSRSTPAPQLDGEKMDSKSSAEVNKEDDQEDSGGCCRCYWWTHPCRYCMGNVVRACPRQRAPR